MTYKSIVATRCGGPEVLQVVEKELCPPVTGEVCLKTLAAPVALPEVESRYGRSPFPPGYAIVGEVEFVGRDVFSPVQIGDRFAAGLCHWTSGL